jgi:hypothetical protein
VWLGGVLALALAGALCLWAPRFGGLTLILIALLAVAIYANRIL